MSECTGSVASIKIPYFVVINGRGFWRPSAKLKLLGFQDVPCGPDSPVAWAIADKWNQSAAATLSGKQEPPIDLTTLSREEAEAVRRYPRGSVGFAFQTLLRTEEWKTRALSTRTKVWWPAWFRIRAMWGDVDPNTIRFEMMSAWRKQVEDTHGRDVAHKTLKIWRALWKIMRGMKIARDVDPSLGVRNRAPQPRSQRWSEGEAVRLVKGAWRAGYGGMACIIAIAWDSTFSPVDVRTLRNRHMKSRTHGLIFDRSVEGRQKTGRAALGTVSRRTQRLVKTYLNDRGVELHAEAFLFCTRSGSHYREATLGHDFAAVRELVFPGDRRRLMDMRRSGAAEAVAGEAKPGTLSAKMANSIESSNSLHKTYSPVDLASVRSADAARLRGRRRMRDENE
jgi:hypothetical protein